MNDEVAPAFAAAATPLYGREAELRAIRAGLDDPSSRLLTLTGRGGVGKTRLASVVASTAVDSGGPPTTFVPLAGVGDEALVVPEIAAALGLPATVTEDPDAVVAARLGSDEHLLILDNLEHVLDVAPRLGALLDRCRGLRILATSQAPLRLRAERVIRIEPLPLPAVEDEQAFDPTQPALALYLASARAAVVGFEVRDGERRAVVDLCRRLEGLPLAIELAGARAASLRPNEIVRCLDEVGISMISRRRGDAPARHHDLVSAIGWTHDLLPPAEQELLAVLSAGAGSFSVETVLGAATGPPDEVLDHFGALVDLHLVEVCPYDPRPVDGPGGPRTDCYQIASSIRAFALGRAEALGVLPAVRQRYVEAWSSQASRAADAIESGASGVPLAMGADGDGLDAALRIALDEAFADEALDLVRVLLDRWDTWGYHAVHEELVERCLDLAELLDADAIRRSRAMAWSVAAGLRHRSSRSQEDLLARLRAAEALGEQVGDDGTVLFALTTWMLIAPITRDIESAARAAERALELATRPPNRRWLASIQVFAGMVAYQQGEVDRAVELGRAALDDARATGDRGALVRTTLLLGPLTSARPEMLADVPSSEEALELARRTGQPFYEAILLARLVWEAVAAGDERRALARSEDSLLMARAMVGSPFVGFQLLEALIALATNGDLVPATRLFGVLRPVLPFLDAYDLPGHREAREALLDQVRTELGDDEFEALAAASAGMAWPDAVELALDATREALGRIAEGRGPEAVPSERHPGDPPLHRLTERQCDVLRLLALGKSNKDIARALGITAKTVMHHTMAIYRELGVGGRNEATAWVFRSGFLDAEALDPPGISS